MQHWMNGSDWAWMSFMMAFGIVGLGAVIYLVVRLAARAPGQDHSSHHAGGTDGD